MKNINLLIIFSILLFFYGCEKPKYDSKRFKNIDYYEKDSPSLGGTGFRGRGWSSNRRISPFGDKKAKKGGEIKVALTRFPRTLRFEGKDSNQQMNGIIAGLMYETLLSQHPDTLEYIPSLATHWQILQDYKTFRFRINPKARWADGTPVTSKDIIASWKFRGDSELGSPYYTKLHKKFKKPIAESRYIIHVTTKELNWKLFLYFAAEMRIYPAHILENITIKEYLTEYDKKFLPGTGPYTINLKLLKKNEQIILERNTNYWAAKEKFTENLYNFDKISFVVQKNRNEGFQNFKKGAFDFYPVYISRLWVKETNFPEIKRGLIQKRKIFNKSPQGFSGFAMNIRDYPFNNKKVRQAFAHLFNRKLLIEKYFFNEYAPLDSYYPFSIYTNPNNPVIRYDFKKALKLLSEAGFVERNKGGMLLKDGKVFEVKALCNPSLKRLFKHYQDDLKKAGIKLALEALTPKNYNDVRNQNFQMAYLAWTGSLFPNPESAWESGLADVPNTNNVCGVKSKKLIEFVKPIIVPFC